jgi:hypothetical protein
MLIVVFNKLLKAYPHKALVAGLLLAGLAGCASNSAWLNSDRIESAFGSYAVEVLRSDPVRRESSLYSTENGVNTTRTYAVVDFPDTPGNAYAREHAEIESGGSIGATFRQAGWSIEKRHLFIGELEIAADYREIGELMQINLPETLAMHQYLMIVRKDERAYTYANRDRIQDFIGPPNPLK